MEGEQSELEQEAETLSHAEEIKAGLYRIEQSFSRTKADCFLS